jgi:hypothetical protein
VARYDYELARRRRPSHRSFSLCHRDRSRPGHDPPLRSDSARSSVDRASRFEREGREFDTLRAHQRPPPHPRSRTVPILWLVTLVIPAVAPVTAAVVVTVAAVAIVPE